MPFVGYKISIKITEYYISNLVWSINWSWWEKDVEEISGHNYFKALNG